MLTHSLRRRFGLFASALAISLLALPLGASAETLIGLTTTNSVLTFDSTAPNGAGSSNNKALFGFQGFQETAVSIDQRPIYGGALTVLTVGQISSDNTNVVGRLYDLNPTTGLLTNARTLTAPFSTSVTYTIDYNPTGVAPLRIIGSDNSNYRYDPTIDTTFVDTALTGAGTPAVGVAYSNNDNIPSTGTQLYYINRSTDRLATTAAPNSGVTTSDFANALGVDLSSTGFQEIDISGSGVAYGVFQLQGAGNTSRLYTIDLVTGEATAVPGSNLVQVDGTPVVIRGLAAAPTLVPENGTMALLTIGITLGGFLVRRRKIS